MLRALNMMHYDSDEEINEDEAFNSEDEAKYGKFFKNTSSSSLKHVCGSPMTCKLLGVTVPVLKGSGESKAITVDILEGTKLMLSYACLDITDSDFKQLRLFFRCLYDNQNDEDQMPWMCLCNFVQKNVLTSVSLGLEIVGPCSVEWKIESTSNQNAGCVNIFGQIVPTDVVSSGSEISFTRGEDHRAFFKDGNEEKQSDFVHIQNDKEEQKVIEGSKPSKSNKRKLEDDDRNDANVASAKDDATPAKNTDSQNDTNSKLTKKQRKHLAEEKAKQLEETLTAARLNESETKSKKKKKKKQSTKDTVNPSETISKPTSLTRERRLPGGILIRDILVGTGTPVTSGRRISLHYTGSLQSNGKVFDKNHSRTHPLQFRHGTGEVIRGLERGLEGMRVGGERVITVPSSLGYGEKGMGESIPPDSDLVFEVKVLKVG